MQIAFVYSQKAAAAAVTFDTPHNSKSRARRDDVLVIVCRYYYKAKNASSHLVATFRDVHVSIVHRCRR